MRTGTRGRGAGRQSVPMPLYRERAGDRRRQCRMGTRDQFAGAGACCRDGFRHRAGDVCSDGDGPIPRV